MSRNLYEGMFLIDANRYASDSQGVTDRITSMLEKPGVELLASRPWDDRRLAYPVKGHRKAVYLLTYFRAEGPEVALIEQECRLNETILRQLILKVDHQLEEDLLAQVVSSPSSEKAEAEGEAGDQDGQSEKASVSAGEEKEAEASK